MRWQWKQKPTSHDEPASGAATLTTERNHQLSRTGAARRAAVVLLALGFAGPVHGQETTSAPDGQPQAARENGCNALLVIDCAIENEAEQPGGEIPTAEGEEEAPESGDQVPAPDSEEVEDAAPATGTAPSSPVDAAVSGPHPEPARDDPQDGAEISQPESQVEPTADEAPATPSKDASTGAPAMTPEDEVQEAEDALRGAVQRLGLDDSVLIERLPGLHELRLEFPDLQAPSDP